MNRKEILALASDYIMHDRNTSYGEPEHSFGYIAVLWRSYLSNRPAGALAKLDAYDVTVMMSLMKIAQMTARPGNPGSAVDLAGYAACAGELLPDPSEPLPAPKGAFNPERG